MAVQVVTLANAFAAVVPAAVVFFVAYGRYDGAFRDNVVFLYFIGGLIAGGFLGFASLFTLASLNALVSVVLLALIVPIAMVAALNRRKWQGERHAIFNGGSFGLGVAVMMAFSFLFFRTTLLRRRAVEALGLEPSPDGAFSEEAQQMVDAFVRDQALSVPYVGQSVLFALGLAGLFFGLGLLLGDGVRRRAQFRVALMGTATVLAPVIFIEELFHAWQLNLAGAWLWAGLIAAYAAIYAVAAERRLLPQGVSDEARRQRRRRRRRARSLE